jgi:DNA-binding IclR family transcriptional regulator
VKRRYTMGSRRPMLFCSSGRVFLANCEASHLSAILSFLETLPINREPLHAANRNELSRMLRSIRRDGFSTYESAEHVTMLSVPIFQEQQILGGLMIRYFSSAMNIGTACERFLSGLQEVAEKIGGAPRPAITRNVA